jgi:pimeloyl-ACP methyl ester carboxylesterase
MSTTLPPLDSALLPHGVRARFVPSVNGLNVHLLEAGIHGRPCLLLLHGFPEIAYSWRRVMPALADAGYYVIAPDLRGYGRTTGWVADYDADLSPWRPTNLARDAVGLIYALGYRSVAAVIGHDFGSPVAAWSTLLRPDIFRSVALMSAPFGGPPAVPFDTLRNPPAPPPEPIDAALARLPRPRKHYHHYFARREANAELMNAPQGLHDFLRAYYHYKSGDWVQNKPHPIAGWTAEVLAEIPAYYIMDLDRTMPQTVAPEMPDPAEISANKWLPDAALGVYAQEYSRNGFQGGLQWYRVTTSGRFSSEQELFTGRTIDVPSLFLSGRRDWGVYQTPGAMERMQREACTRMLICELIDGAGHWPQQEKPEETVALLLRFLQEQGASADTGC